MTLSVQKDEYKTVSVRTISVGMNAPCGLTRLRNLFPYANQRFVYVRRMLCLIGATDVFLIILKIIVDIFQGMRIAIKYKR